VIGLPKITHRKFYRRLQGMYRRRSRAIFGVLKVGK